MMVQRRIQEDESIASRTKTRCCLGGQRDGCSGPELPEEIWCHIHSLLPMRDAAQVACVSQDFFRSWRFRPHLTFDKQTLGLDQIECQNGDQIKYFTSIVDSILKNHSGIGVKKLKFNFCFGNGKEFLDHLDSWLQVVVKPGIEEIEVYMPRSFTLYNFPVSLLSAGVRASLRSFNLMNCKFEPSVRSDSFRSLTVLRLNGVYIEDDTLSCILSNTPALEILDIRHCCKLICIRIPYLQQLNYLGVTLRDVKSVQIKAPNLSSLHFEGDFNVVLLPEGRLQIKKLHMCSNNSILKSCTEFPSVMPNLETLAIYSLSEEIKTPIPSGKYLQLKFLNIFVYPGTTYDLLSLVSVLHVCPSLETFVVEVSLSNCEWVSIFDDPSDLRTMPMYRHDKLKNVQFVTFMHARQYIEFACHFLEFATSLERLTLNTIYGMTRCYVSKTRKCRSITKHEVIRSKASNLAIERYVRPKAPSTVLLNVWGPCSSCHADLL